MAFRLGIAQTNNSYNDEHQMQNSKNGQACNYCSIENWYSLDVKTRSIWDRDETNSLNFHNFTVLVYHFGWLAERNWRWRLSQTDLMLWFQLIVIYLLHCQTVVATAHLDTKLQIINDMEMAFANHNESPLSCQSVHYRLCT